MQVSQIFAVMVQPDIYLWIIQGIGGPPTHHTGAHSSQAAAH